MSGTERLAYVLMAYVLITLIAVTIMGTFVPILGTDGFEVSGELKPCESREVAPCYTIGDGRVYLNLHPDMRSMAGILAHMEGRQVVIAVYPK